MRLPRADAAIVDLGKIEDYCLNPAHSRGRHKARVFRQTLGIGREEAAWLRQAILDGARSGEAVGLERDAFGQRFRMDLAASRQGRSAMIRTIWMIRTGEELPRFVTCWVL